MQTQTKTLQVKVSKDIFKTNQGTANIYPDIEDVIVAPLTISISTQTDKESFFYRLNKKLAGEHIISEDETSSKESSTSKA